MGFNSSILQPVSIASGPVVSVSQFGAVGDGKTNDTAAIQSALNYIETHGGTLNFEAGRTYIVSKSLVIAGADDFKIDGNGATIKMASGAPVQTGYSVLRIETCDNFAVTELTVDGNRANRSPAEVPAHNIIIKSSHDFSFSDVKSLNAVADGFYMGTATKDDRSTYTQNGLFLNCQADNGFRQGMSIINGENIQVIGGAYTNSNGTNPAAGIDIEANEGTAIPGNHNILIRGVTLSGNDGYGVQLSAKGLPTDITIEGCYFSDNDRGAIRLSTARTLIQGNTFEDFSLSERGLIDLGSAQTNSDNVITGNSFNNISTGNPVIFAHSNSGTNNQVYDNKYYDIDGSFLHSGTKGTTGWNNVLTGSPSYPPGSTEPPVDQILEGGAGNDTLDGGIGADTMQGGAGDDTYVVDAVGDVVAEASNAGTDTVRSTLSYTLGGNLENLVLLAAATALVGTGNSLANEVTGNDGDNILDGKAGADTMTGGKGDDVYVRDVAGDLVIEGGDDADDEVQSAVGFSSAIAGIEHYTFTGRSKVAFTADGKDNRITGTAAADTLDGAGGSDTLKGGAGNDVYVVDAETDDVVENLSQGTDLVKSSVHYTLGDNIETLELIGAGDIDGIGNALNNVVTGNAGNNQLSGAAGNDTLVGAEGNDILDGGDGKDAMAGGSGNDVYVVGDAADKVVEISAAGGKDTVRSTIAYTLGKYVEDLELTAGDTRGTGNTLDNLLVGSDGNNILDGNVGADTMRGGLGDDVYIADLLDEIDETDGSGKDTILIAASFDLGMPSMAVSGIIENLILTGRGAFSGTGTAGDNAITGNADANILDGDGGNDSLAGGSGNDSVVGDAGDDTLDGGAGSDTMIGGAGDDTYVVDSTKDFVQETGGGIDRLQAKISIDLAQYAGIENVALTGSAALEATGDSADNELTGNDGANLLRGRDGSDTLGGKNGNDTLDGGAGADALIGGLGNDTYLVDDAGDDVTEAENEGADTVRTTSSGYTLTANVENLVLLASAAGGTGNAGKNTLTGNDFANTLDGGAEVDKLIGGKGDDSYVVDETKDAVTETSGKNSGNDTVTSTAAAYTLGSNVENLILGGVDDIAGTGNVLDNILTGNAGNNTLNGGGGADTMNAGFGNDTYIADAKDAIADDGGFDVVQAAFSVDLTLAFAGIEGIKLTGTGALSAMGNENANLLIGNTRANKLVGSGGADTLEGGAGDDTIDGGADDDLITGGAGTDRIDVGDGNDTVFYAGRLDGRDIIDSFDGDAAGGQDVLDLDALFDSLAVTAAMRAARLFVDAQTASVDVRVDADGNGTFESVIATLNTTDAIAIGDDIVVGT